jgi:hypothetical protein
MNLKELKEAQQGGLPVKFIGEKCIIHQICNEYTGVERVTKVILHHATHKNWESTTTDLESITLWGKPINKGEKMKTQAEKTLDLIRAVIKGEVIERLNGCGVWCSSRFIRDGLIAAIISAPDKYRVKPKTKTINYQTRLCKITGGIYQWSSLGVNGANKKHLEDEYVTLEWLEPTQEHSFTYEEK